MLQVKTLNLIYEFFQAQNYHFYNKKSYFIWILYDIYGITKILINTTTQNIYKKNMNLFIYDYHNSETYMLIIFKWD